MTKHVSYKTFTSVISVVHLDKVTCDKCGEEIIIPKGQIRNLTLSFTKGSLDSTNRTDEEGWQIEDLCDICLGRLVTLLKDNGYFPVAVFRSHDAVPVSG